MYLIVWLVFWGGIIIVGYYIINIYDIKIYNRNVFYIILMVNEKKYNDRWIVMIIEVLNFVEELKVLGLGIFF